MMVEALMSRKQYSLSNTVLNSPFISLNWMDVVNTMPSASLMASMTGAMSSLSTHLPPLFLQASQFWHCLTDFMSFRLNLTTSFPVERMPSSMLPAILSPKPPLLGLETIETTTIVSQ